MKKIFTLFVLLLCLKNTKAQLVTIPDAQFVSWLQTNVPSAMTGNQMDTTSLAVTTKTIVNINGEVIFDIDGIQYFKSLKNFECSSTFISSMPVLPNTIIHFDCSNNYSNIVLTSLPNSLEVLICDNSGMSVLPALPPLLKILSCTGNPISSLPNLPSLLDSLDCRYLSLSTLPTLPNNLKKLDCSGNSLLALPNLPSSLLFLDCSMNTISSLPTLPASLQKIDCYYNALTSLPTLPSIIKKLDCYSNSLSTLPTLPNSIKSINCSENPLSGGLPSLPNSLEYLNCGHSSITNLPTLPNSLKVLKCDFSNISTLPVLSNNLDTLDCSFNSIAILPTLPNGLRIIYCAVNGLTTIPNFPNSLEVFMADHNALTVLPALPNNLNTLDVSANHIDSLPHLPNSLVYLNVESNQMLVLNQLPNNLIHLLCGDNQLTSLPPLPPFLQTFYAFSNNINCFESFPNSINAIIIHNNPFTCLPNHLPSMSANLLGFPLCVLSNTVTNPNNCPIFQGIEGIAYNDADNNCVKTTDQYVTNIKLKLFDSNNILMGNSYTFGAGSYNFALSSGTYKVELDTLNIPYKIVCMQPGLDSLVTLTSTVTTVNNIDFAINCKPGLDLGIQSILNDGLVFPGLTHTLSVNAGDISQWYHMNCATGVSGTVSFSVNGPVTYVSPGIGALTPSITGNVYSYYIADFGTINNASAFDIILNTNTSAQIGDNVCVSASVTTTSSDNNLNNNNSIYCYNVFNSYDPNIKEVYPINVQPGFNDWLTYTIHFQNTGNAPAYNIRLADTLDNMLDLETFQVINYSHINNTTLNGNVLNVYFPNIMLPDSTSNPSGSIGYIQYRIKPKATWAAPYKIKNTAYIYFDYNAPIVTNSTYNSILVPTGLNNQTEALATLYPNPTNGTFTVELNTKEKQSLQVVDIRGQMVLSQTIENGKATIDANHLASGIYTINIKGSGTFINKKLVVVK